MPLDTDGKLPVVIPVVVTHPRSLWKEKRISDFVSMPSEAFRAYIPDFDYILYNSTREDPDQYEFNEAVKALLTLWRYSHRPEFMDGLEKVFRLIRQINPDVKLRDYLSLVMQYLYVVRGEDEYIDIEKIAKREIPGEEEYMGTIAEMLERRGREEGVIIGAQQGKIEAAQEMIIEALGERFGTINHSLVEKIKHIQSVDTLKILFRQCFRVDFLEKFEEQVRRATE